MKTARSIGILLCVIALPILANIAMRLGGVALNLSPSVPLGYYIRTDSPAAPFALICPDQRILEMVRNQGVSLPAGACPTGVQPFVKPALIRPTPSDPLVFTSAGFSYRGRLLPNTKAKDLSIHGHTLEHYPWGTYTSGLWAISTYNRDSFDSRYFGPIRRDAVLAHARPFVTLP